MESRKKEKSKRMLQILAAIIINTEIPRTVAQGSFVLPKKHNSSERERESAREVI